MTKNQKIEVQECKHCGHRWVPRIANPIDCPKCRKYLRDQKKLVE